MLKKEFRLSKRDDFLSVKEAKNICWGKYFGISKMPKDTFKLGFLTTKKVMPRAVDRNRFRRVFSQAILDNVLPKNGWFVIIAKKEAKGVRLFEIKDEISSFAGFIGI